MNKLNLATKIFIGLILGVLVGLFLTSSPHIATTYIKPLGTLFLNLIKMIIVPLVLSSLVVGSASTGDIGKLGRMGIKTIAFFLITTGIAITIGLVIGNIMKPGIGINLPSDAVVETKEIPSISETLTDMVPTNPIAAMVEANMLQIIVFALFLGVAITLVGEKARPFLTFFESMAEVCYKIVAIVMEFAPLGVFGLMVPTVAEHGPAVLLPLLKVIVAMYISCIIHVIVVYSGVVSIFGKMSPATFFKGASPAMLLAFTTSSSSGTLPVSMNRAENNLGVPKPIASFVLPLGATINMDGAAIYQGLCALFVAQVYGINLTISQQLIIALTGTLASIGAAGVPGASLIILSMVLQSVGLPMEGIALLAGIDRVLDMARTCLNVTGDLAISVIIAATEGELKMPQTESIDT